VHHPPVRGDTLTADETATGFSLTNVLADQRSFWPRPPAADHTAEAFKKCDSRDEP
jgi:hypothetical protein